MLALVLLTMLAGSGEGAQARNDGDAAGPAPSDPGPVLRSPVPELRLGGGTFTLKLNTGSFAAQAARPDPPAGPFDIDGGLDLRERRGRLRLGGGDERRLRLAVEWDVNLDSDMARVHSQIDLGFFGHALTLTPPDVRVRPRFDGGQPGVDVSIPIVEGRF